MHPISCRCARRKQTNTTVHALGHTVRIVPAQFVKPYVKSNKNDTIGAAAIAEAVTRPTMRFIEVNSVEPPEFQALHRIRDRMVANRTRVTCQMRAFCLEFGVAIHQGADSDDFGRAFRGDVGHLVRSMSAGRSD